jgi:hypothetical protein
MIGSRMYRSLIERKNTVHEELGCHCIVMNFTLNV